MSANASRPPRPKFLERVHLLLQSFAKRLGARTSTVRAWAQRKPNISQTSKFGLTDLEVSLVVILFFVQVAFPMMGISQNFWGALFCWAGIFFLGIRIIWKWETAAKINNGAKLLTSIGVIGLALYLIVGPMTRTFYLTVRPSYVLLVPSEQLIDCERRAFIVKHFGAKVLPNVAIDLFDNNAGTYTNGNSGAAVTYPEIGPGTPDPVVLKLMWWSPVGRWDEDYTIEATSGDIRITQKLNARAMQGQWQLATEVSVNGNAVFGCRDPLLPSSYTVALSAKHTCADLLPIPQEVTAKITASGSSYQMPDGKFTLRAVRELSPTSGTEGQSEERHIWEYQRVWLRAALSRYSGNRLLVLVSSAGEDTEKYSEELTAVFNSSGWNVDGPHKLPQNYNGLFDIQISSNSNVKDGSPRVKAILDALTHAGIKHRSTNTNDPDIEPGLIVIFVGSRSPLGVEPDDCESVPFLESKLQTMPCSAVRQTANHACPLVPH